METDGTRYTGRSAGMPCKLVDRPSTRSKLPGIEAARGIAALMVVMVHAMAILSGPADFGIRIWGGLPQFGRAGVDFFFVLSGFIITYVHSRDINRPRAFLVFWSKRCRRIYPTYWVILAAWGALLWFSPTRTRFEQDPTVIFLSIFLLPTTYEPILGVAWSLRHELVFYAVFSLAILNRQLGLLVLTGWFATIVLNILVTLFRGAPPFGGIIGEVVVRVFNIQFLFGMFVAWLVQNRRSPWPTQILFVGLGLFLVNGLAESFLPSVQHEWPVRHLIYAVASAMVIYGLSVLDRARAVSVPRVLLELGACSYTLYLIHPMVLIIGQQFLRRMRPWIFLPIEISYALLVCSCVVVSIVFSRTIERRLMQLGIGPAERRPSTVDATP